MASPIIPILLAGGAGTRLWPVSRDALPKQFLPLIGDKSTYQETLLRVRDAMFAPPIVITGPNFHFFARRQAEEIGVDATIVIEPMRRDSGPAIAAATMVASRRDPKAVVLALAADHIIPDVDAFRATCRPDVSPPRQAALSPSVSSRRNQKPATATFFPARRSVMASTR